MVLYFLKIIINFHNNFLLGRFRPANPSRQVQLTYQTGCLCSYLDIQYPILFWYFDLKIASLASVFVGILFVVSVYLNYRKFYLHAKLVLFFSLLACVIFYSVLLGQDAGAHLILFGMTVFPTLIFEAKKIKLILFLSILPPLTFLILELLDLNIMVNFLDKTVTDITYLSGGLTGFAVVLYQIGIYQLNSLALTEKLLDKNRELAKALRYSRTQKFRLEDAAHKLKSQSKRDAEYKLARSFQKRYLPELYEYNGIKPYVIHRPSQYMVSGDFYDLRASSSNDIGYLLIDVAGKGIEASYVTIQLHQIFRKHLKGTVSPRDVMQMMNDEVKEIKTLKKMCVAAYLSFNPKEKKVSYCRAGLDFLSICRNGKFIDLDIASPPIGFSETNEFVEAEVVYEPGDILTASTDGIIDARNEDGERFGVDRFKDSIGDYFKNDGARDIDEIITDAFVEFTGETPLVDDVTVLIFKLD